jgi:hypothetical protein
MNIAIAIVFLASLMLAVCVLYLGAVRSGYSQLRDTINELGESGAPNSKLVAYGVFLPFGLAMLVVAWLSYPENLDASRVAACLAVGYIGAAVFPCDPGSPLSGSWRQSLHNIAGTIHYFGGGVVLWQLRSVAPLFDISSLVVLVAAGLLSSSSVSAVRGGIQRVAEVALLGGLWAILILQEPSNSQF